MENVAASENGVFFIMSRFENDQKIPCRTRRRAGTSADKGLQTWFRRDIFRKADRLPLQKKKLSFTLATY